MQDWQDAKDGIARTGVWTSGTALGHAMQTALGIYKSFVSLLCPAGLTMGAVSSVPLIRSLFSTVFIPASIPNIPRPPSSPLPTAAALPQPNSIDSNPSASTSAALTPGSAGGPSAPHPSPAVSLGAALFGLPAAPGFMVPGEEVPGAWLVLLIEGHADGAVFSRLFCASRATQVWCLQHVPTAHLAFRLGPVEEGQLAWPQRFDAARARLGVRGPLPTRLTVQEADTYRGTPALADVVNALAGVGQGVVELVVETDRSPAQFVQTIAAHIPNLTTLTLKYNHCVLPPPTSYPQLRQLSMGDVQLSSCRSIAEYTSQLKSLSIDPRDGDAAGARHVFSTILSAVSTTLTTFVTREPLTDSLLDLLLRRAPALTELFVCFIFTLPPS